MEAVFCSYFTPAVVAACLELSMHMVGFDLGETYKTAAHGFEMDCAQFASGAPGVDVNVSPTVGLRGQFANWSRTPWCCTFRLGESKARQLEF
jgi:hypothetical protein